MNWDAASAVAQLLATLGLFISIVYAGVQLRQSAKLARVTAEEVAAASFRDVILPVAQDPELARIWQTGLADPAALSPADAIRFYFLSFQAMKAAETVHSSYLDRVMDDDTWVGWDNVLKRHLSTPGLRQYWADRKDMFAPRFRAYVDGLTVADLQRVSAS